MRSSKKQKPVVVLDSNVWVSAIIWGGRPARVVSLAERNAITIAISGDVLDEIRRILGYRKLAAVYAQVGVTRADLVAKILGVARLVRPRTKVGVVEADPSDNRVLECALAAKASHIISGDEHLRQIGRYAGIAITSVKDFLQDFDRKKPST